MNMFAKNYMRLQHDYEVDEGYEEKRTKMVSSSYLFLGF